MLSKMKEHRSIETRATSTTPAEVAEAQVMDSARHKKIRIRASEIYLERGEQLGRELEDWLQAERELLRNTSNLHGVRALDGSSPHLRTMAP